MNKMPGSQFTVLGFKNACKSLGRVSDSTSILKALSDKQGMKRHSPAHLFSL